MGRIRTNLMLILCLLLFGMTGAFTSVAHAEGAVGEVLATAGAVNGLRDDPGDPPDISFDPASIEAELFTGGRLDTIVTVTNENNTPVDFRLEGEITQEGRDGPGRDDAGDLLGQFQGINQANVYCSPVGWDWDNERMWVTQYNGGIAAAYTHDNNYENFEEVLRINCGSNMDGCWADGYFFVPTGLGSAQVNRWDPDGQNIGAINFGFGVYGLAADIENEWLFALSSNDWGIYVYPLDGEGNIGNQIGVISQQDHQQFHGNQIEYGLEWVAKHPDGQLWFVNYQDANIYQISVDTDQWTCIENVQRFQVLPGADQPYTSSAHDGKNMWVGGYGPATIRVYDDGVAEMYWLMFAPTEGQIAAGGSQEITVTLDAYGLVAGTYRAILHFLSNDQAQPDAEVEVILNVEGAPDIEVVWEEDWGFPELVDWNLRYLDLFSGGPYDMPVTIRNAGTDDLSIDAISIGHEYFTPDAEQFVLGPGEEQVVTITFNAPAEDPNVFEPLLTINCNDPDEAEIDISLHAEASLPPILVLDRNAYQTALTTGDVEDFVINIANDGDAILRWESDIEIMQEGRRDSNGRIVRSLAGSPNGPRRDEVDLDGMMFAVFTTNSVWGWLDEGMRQDPLLDENNMISYRNADDLNNVDFADYDVICFSTYNQQFNQQYANNLGRLEEYVANGGSLYYETANSNAAIRSPGGIYNDGGDRGSSNGILVVSPDPNAENYSLFAEICQSTQPDNWNEGEVIEGSSWLHGSYTEQQFIDGVDDGTLSWYQIIAIGQDNNLPGAVAYGFGSGAVLTVAHPSAHCWFNYNQEGMWGSIAAEILFYLTEVGGGRWISVDPSEGELQSGADENVNVHLDSFGLYTGVYVADIHILSNDPADPDQVCTVTIDVTGAPDIDVRWDDEAGYPENIDWNMVFGDELYAGGPYQIPVIIDNVGTDDLEVTDVACDIGAFTTNWDPDAQRVVGPGEQTTIIVTLEVADPGALEGTLTITSNDGDEEVVNVSLLGNPTNPPILTLSLNAVNEEMVTGDELTQDVEIGNDGEAILRFFTDLVILQEPGGRDADARSIRSLDGSTPTRDEPGELLGQFQGINQQGMYCSPVGWDWDNERMWVTQYNNAIAAAYTHDANYENFEEVLRINCGNNMDGCWADGYLFLPTSLGANQINRWDADGQNVGAINVGFGVYGLAADIENEWLFVMSSNDWGIHVYELDGEGNIGDQIGVISQQDHQQFHGNQVEYGFEWVPKHPDGQLWFVNYQDANIYQIAVDTDQWTCIESVQRFPVLPGADQPYTSSAHDGHNMWVAGYNPATIRVYDDGVTEAYWLVIDPKEGEIQPGGSVMGVITLNAAGLIGGQYIADIVFISNDPAHPLEEPDGAIRVTIDVTGVPNMDVTPGGPEEEEPPADIGTVYFGYPRSLPVSVENIGTEDLELSDVISDQENPDFYVNGDDLQGFILAVGEKRDLQVWYNPDEQRGEGEHSATLMFVSSDPRYPDGYPVRVVANALTRPILALEFEAIDRELNEGDVEEVVVDLGNDGGSQLNWEAEIEIIGQPGRDAATRSIRSLDGSAGPQRDDPGDLLGQFQGVNQANIYCSPVGWDWDNERMWVTQYNNAFAVAYTHDARYENFEEVIRINCGNNMDGCWADGYLFLPNGLGGNVINRWDADGQNIGGFNVAFGVYGLAADIENEWLFLLSSNDQTIHVYQLDGEGGIDGNEIGVIRNHAQFHNNAQSYTIEWVPKHPAGQLWMFEQGGTVFEIAVNTEDWTCTETVQNIRVMPNADQIWSGVAHDGHNLWAGGYAQATIRIYDDGVFEAYWLSMEPMEGSLASGSSMNVTVALNTIGNLGGRYAADIHFLSNDPAAPDQVIAVTLNITGQSVFGSEPVSAPFSENPAINFPIAYDGAESSFEVVFTNVGSGIYTVNGFEVDGDNPDDFGIAMDAPFEINASSDSTVVFFFRPTATGERHARLHLITDANNVDGQDVYWDVTGICLLPPSIYTRPENGVPRVYAASQGDPETAALVIGNAEGQDRDTLSYKIYGVGIEEGRDASGRTIRSLANTPVGPRRDAAGDSLDRIDVDHYGSFGISHDIENDVMWINFCDQRGAVTNFWTGYQWDGSAITGVVADFEVNLNGTPLLGGCYYDGVLYSGRWDGNSSLMRFDIEGNNLGDVNVAGAQNSRYTMACAVDPERAYLFVTTLYDANFAADVQVHVFDINNDFEEIGLIEDFMGHGANVDFRGRLTWIPDHNTGHLWATREFRAYQLAVNEIDWTVEIVQDFPVTSDVRSPGIGHDGRNLWIGNNVTSPTVTIWDDGVSEGPEWLTFDPEKGDLLAGEEEEITITCTPGVLEDGVYEARLLIKSNDPGNREFYLGVSMEIGGEGPAFEHFGAYDAEVFPNGWRVTGSDHSVLVNNVVWDDNVAPDGWEIGVFTPGGVLSGGAVWTGGDPVGVAVYGAEGDIAQFQGGETMMFKVWDNEADVEHEVTAEVSEGSTEWSAGGFTVLTLNGIGVYTCEVPFGAGWNLISINVTPPQELWNANGPDIRLMMDQFRIDAEHHHVVLMKNERGNFYAPANNNFNNIPFWNTAEGYQVRMDAALQGSWSGVKIDDQADVPVAAGWNMVAYYPSYQLSCARNSFTAISPIADNVILAKDGFGHFASVRNNFSNMDPWREGRGYQINVNASVVLNYPAAQQGAAAIKVGESDASVVGRWAEPAMTGANMSVLVTGISGVELAATDQVAAFSVSGRLVGVGRVTEGMIGLAVWGDDKSTDLVDGLVEGEAFTLKLWDADKDAVVDLRMEGLVYATDGFTASDAVAGAIIPDNYSLGQNFPNPFNAVTRIAFGLPEASRVSIRVFDVAGREVATLVSGNLEAGNHTAVWSAEGFNSGVYLVKMETPSFSDVRKVTLIK